MRFLLKLLLTYIGVGMLILIAILVALGPGRRRHHYWTVREHFGWEEQ